MKCVKFCGIRRDEDVTFVNELLPEYIGLIFYEKSHRNVTKQRAKQIRQALSPEIKAVGVFVDKPVKEVADICSYAGLNLIQLHGNEDEDYITGLRKLTDLPVIKAVRFKNADDLYNAQNLSADYLLVDTYIKDSVGGTGKTFDWNKLPPLNKPYFLAGGITTDNFKDALKTDAYCIDISSGIETDKVKDYDKMKQIIYLKGKDENE